MSTLAADMTGESSIRSVGRAIRVLQEINHHRSLGMTAISKLCDLPYPTAYRIVEALIAEGMVERETTRKRYRPTEMVRTLSAGYQRCDDIAQIARPHITRLTREIRWPITVCTRVGMSMMIRESTHAIAPFTLNVYHPGYTMPLLGSSSGKAQLAFSSEQDRQLVLSQLSSSASAHADRMVAHLSAEFAAIRENGYASCDRIRHTANPGKTSAISVPVLSENGCEATVTLAFFHSALTVKDAVCAFLPGLKETAQRIGDDLGKTPN